MRKLSTILLFFFCIGFSYAQKSVLKHIPTEAITKFNVLYPNAKDVDWFKNSRIYVAEFLDESMSTAVIFDLNGKLMQVVQYIQPKDLPKDALDYIKKYFSVKKIKEISKIKDAKDDITYIVEVKKVALVFDEEGRFQRISK